MTSLLNLFLIKLKNFFILEKTFVRKKTKEGLLEEILTSRKKKYTTSVNNNGEVLITLGYMIDDYYMASQGICDHIVMREENHEKTKITFRTDPRLDVFLVLFIAINVMVLSGEKVSY